MPRGQEITDRYEAPVADRRAKTLSQGLLIILTPNNSRERGGAQEVKKDKDSIKS